MSKLYEQYGEVINQPTSLVMSGVESDAYFDIAVGEGIDRLLVSYHYIQRKGKNFLRERLKKHPNVKIMIDSGAYTFHVKEEEYKDKPMEFWDKYLANYVKFIKANKDIIFSCVELDIANIVGFEKVDYFREKYFEPLKEEGVLVCYVWHGYDGMKYWEEMCKKYDYVGFSLQGDKLSEAEITKFINIARRHNTLVHGFALTRTEIMSKVPFFTGDSTTWLVGTQYGELNWFDGRKMKRLKKDKWKGEYRQKFIKIGANWDLAGQENPYELIRINLIVFKQAEEFIRKRIKGKSYWMNKQVSGEGKLLAKKVLKRKKKPETVVDNFVEVSEEQFKEKVHEIVNDFPERPKSKFEEFQELSVGKELRDLDSVVQELPDLDWYDGDCEDYKEKAKLVGLPSSMSQEEVIDILYNFSLFLVEPNELANNTDEEIMTLHEFTIKTPVETREKAIEELTQFFIQNATGERTDFLSDMFDDGEAVPYPKEREVYLEEDDFQLVDMSEEEMENFLPAPEDMPEVSELDKELASKGVVAVRDDKGRFVKGQKKVRKPKQIWSEKFPKLACNTCYKAADCPEYKPDMACAYDKIFKKFSTRSIPDLLDAMHSMADVNMERMQRLYMFEILDGGVPDGNLTSMIDQNMRLMQQMKQLHEQSSQIVAMQRREISSTGSETITTTVSNPSGGILEKLFGGSESDNKERKEVNEDIIDMEM